MSKIFRFSGATLGLALSCSANVGEAPPDPLDSVPAGAEEPLTPPGLAPDSTGLPGNGSPPASAPMPAGSAPQSSADPNQPAANTERARAAKRCAEQGEALHVGVTRLRRLTRSAYDNTVRDLLGLEGSPASGIESDESIGPFYSNAIAPVTDLIVEQYQRAAASVAERALPRMSEIAGCDLDERPACMTSFVEDFGKRVYRRPLTPDEADNYRALFTDAPDAESGFRAVVETMLQSPYFLYHYELGSAAEPSTEPTPLSQYELASRLSYFLWNTMPDAALFDSADSQQLRDPEVLAEHVRRMLDDPRAEHTIALFHEGLLGLRSLFGAERDPQLFPNFDATLKQAMFEETVQFADGVIRRGDGTLGSLLTASHAHLSESLVSLYGVQPPADFEAEVPLDSTQRAGLLTRAAFLTAHAHRDQTSPVHRGILVRENLLCQIIPSPPADVDNTAPSVNAATTTRERFAQHVEDPSCAACHTLIDPIGLGFENYDPIGAYRTHEGSFEVDASGEVLAAGSDVEGPFTGAVELSQRLARSEMVSACFSKQWFRFALGRMESSDDACSLDALYGAMERSGGNVRELLAALVQTPAFTHVRTQGEAQPQ